MSYSAFPNPLKIISIILEIDIHIITLLKAINIYGGISSAGRAGRNVLVRYSHLTMMQEYELLRGMWIPVSQVRVLYPAPIINRSRSLVAQRLMRRVICLSMLYNI